MAARAGILYFIAVSVQGVVFSRVLQGVSKSCVTTSFATFSHVLHSLSFIGVWQSAPFTHLLQRVTCSRLLHGVTCSSVLQGVIFSRVL